MSEDQKKFEITPVESPAHLPIGMSDSLFFNTARFELAQRVARVFAESSMVPTQFQGNIGNCVIALNLADRMKCDPFMLMQNMYIVHGKPGIEAKLAIALVNNSGRFSPLQYEYNTDKTECHAWAIEKKTGEVCHGVTVSLQMARDEGWMSKQGSKWKTMPELMLMYRSAMFFARAYCPEALLGMQTREELYDVGAVDMVSTGGGGFEVEPTTDDLAAKILNGDAVKPTIEPEKFETKPDPLVQAVNQATQQDLWYHTDHWLNTKQTGFSAFCIDNAERLQEIPDNAMCKYKNRSMRVIDALREKWQTVNPDVIFPGDTETPMIKTEVVYDPADNEVWAAPNGDSEVQSNGATNGEDRTKRMELVRLEKEFPIEWDKARFELGFGRIATSEEAASIWIAKISEILDRNNQ